MRTYTAAAGISLEDIPEPFRRLSAEKPSPRAAEQDTVPRKTEGKPAPPSAIQDILFIMLVMLLFHQ